MFEESQTYTSMHSSFDLKEARTRAAQGRELALWKLRQEAPVFEVRLGFISIKKGKDIQTRLAWDGGGVAYTVDLWDFLQ